MLAGVRPGWQDPTTAEAVVSDASSRSSDSNYLDQGESAKRPVRPPRPALLRSLEEQRADAQPVAEEHSSISFSHGKAAGNMSRPWEDTKLPSHPVRADPKLKVEKMLEPARRAAEADRKAVKGAVAAIGNLVQEQLQMKYGISLDLDDFIRKVDSLCRAQLNGEDWDPQQVVSCLNGIKDMRFRTRDAARVLELRLEPRSTPSFESLVEEVNFMLGTSSAVAVVTSRGGPSTAVAVFREDYARPRIGLVGRCYDLSSEPLASFTASQLDYALMLSVSIVEVLRLQGEAEALPRLRAEYLSLNNGKASASRTSDVPEPVTQEQNISRQVSEQRGRQGLADALMERRAAEASQPSVVSMAMDWLWSGGRSSWMPSSSSQRPQRTGTSAPPSSQRHVPQYPNVLQGEATKLNLQKVPRKISPTGRFGYSPGRFSSHRSSSRPGARQMDTPAPLLMAAGPGPATLSRADSPETPPAARMRKDEVTWGEEMPKDLVIEDPPQRPRRDKSANWGFCS